MKVFVRLFGGPAADGVMMALDLPCAPTPGDVIDTYGEGGVGGVYVVRRRHWYVSVQTPCRAGADRDAAADVIVECDHMALAQPTPSNVVQMLRN